MAALSIGRLDLRTRLSRRWSLRILLREHLPHDPEERRLSSMDIGPLAMPKRWR